MTNRLAVRLGALSVLSAALLHCNASPSGQSNADDDDEEVGSQASAVSVTPRCYGKMLKPTPLELDQPIGLAMTVRVNRECERGAPLVDRKLRIYIRRDLGAGAYGPQQLLMDWADWPGAQYRFNQSWNAGSLASGGTLAPGRYQIYSYTIDASLYAGWVANDPYARSMSKRSDNTYIQLNDPGTWSSTSWSACSAACDGGTQTRTSQCVDGSANVLESRMCLTSAPVDTQACNTSACTYSWSTTSFGACSVSCGGGTRSRTVTCTRDADGATVADALCNPGTKPVSSQSCNTGACANNSCVGRCGMDSTDHSCWCDSICVISGDCCADHSLLCI